MSFAAYKMMQCPTGIDNCAAGFLTHSRADSVPLPPPDDLDADWSSRPRRHLSPLPNLVVSAANVLELYIVRLQEDQPPKPAADSRRGALLDGIAGASLELVCHYRLHGNVETMAVLSIGGGDASRKRDSIILTFTDAKISVLEYDDSIHGLRTSSLHCFEGPEWFHLKRGREQFARGPVVKVDPQGRCGGVLIYDLQMIILKATQVLETADLLSEVTESVDYYVQGKTLAAGNLFGRRRVIQVYERGARILDGSFMTQDVSFGAYNSESSSASESAIALSVSIADPFVLLRMSDGSIRLLIGDSKKGDRGSDEVVSQGRKENVPNMKVVELAMQRWSGQHSRPFLFGILSDGTILCYHAYLYESPDGTSKVEDSASVGGSIGTSSTNVSRLRNLRFVRVPLDAYARQETSNGSPCQQITIFKNIGSYKGFFLSGSRPAWVMVLRERLRVHPQLCDGSIVAFTVLHNVNCNHGLIYVTSQGVLKICQLPSGSNYDSYWPVQKIPLKATPHQVTYFAEKNLYPIIVSFPVLKPLNQVISLVDQDFNHQNESQNMNSDEQNRFYPIDEFEVRIMEPEKSGGPWQTKATIPMQSSENALTVRMVTLLNTTSKENETLLAIGTAYVQGEDVAARGRILLFSLGKNTDNPQNLVSEVYSKELKGAISALASLQGHLLIASGPKIILHKWNGTELNGIAFFDAPPLHVVSLNIVKNFILIGDIHKSIYFLSWKEQGAQLSLLAKDFGSLDCFATEFLIDGSTLSLMVSDDNKNIQIFYYAPKMSESWKGQKLLSRAEFHVGAHVTKFLRLQMLSTSDRAGSGPGSDKTNRFALLFGTLDGSIGCIAPLDEITFRRLQSLQKKLVDAVPHVAGLNPKAFRQFRSNGKAHRPGPDSIVDCELLCHYEMLPLEDQLEIAHQVGTTRSQILSNLSDLSLGTSFL